jgi:hypothetical protein
MDNNNLKPHYKFLKHREFKIGEFLPFSIHLGGSYSPINVELSSQGTAMFFLSQYCAACNYQPVISFMDKYDFFGYIIFLESDEEYYQKLLGKCKKTIYRCNISTLLRQLNIPGIPWTIGINDLGQIISGGVFNTLGDLEIILKPFITVNSVTK